jgi:hypothetical protein
MKGLFFVVLAFAMVSVGTVSAHAAPNFSGTWVLDINKSDLGMKNPAAMARMKKVVLIIKHTANKLSIERSTGEVAVYSLDGRESVNSLPGGGQAKTTMSWSGDTLVSKTISNLSGSNVKSTDVRSLGANGHEMVLKVSLQMPSGERRQTLIYIKQ